MGTNYGFETSTLRQNNLKRTGEQARDPPGLHACTPEDGLAAPEAGCR